MGINDKGGRDKKLGFSGLRRNEPEPSPAGLTAGFCARLRTG
jgi:hypothetical protein